jgi:hypothetical protein
VSPNDDWTKGSINGRGRIVKNSFYVCGGAPATHFCVSRKIGATSNASDLALPDEPAYHTFGFPLMIGNRQWVTGGELAGESFSILYFYSSLTVSLTKTVCIAHHRPTIGVMFMAVDI